MVVRRKAVGTTDCRLETSRVDNPPGIVAFAGCSYMPGRVSILATEDTGVGGTLGSRVRLRFPLPLIRQCTLQPGDVKIQLIFLYNLEINFA